jgi:hypothetical protein
MYQSPSQIQKIAKARAAASQELPQARLCSAVVLAFAESPTRDATRELSVAVLKDALGSNWSPVTAFQFMSGMRGQFAAECSLDGEREQMLLAHKIAKTVCESGMPFSMLTSEISV